MFFKEDGDEAMRSSTAVVRLVAILKLFQSSTFVFNVYFSCAQHSIRVNGQVPPPGAAPSSAPERPTAHQQLQLGERSTPQRAAPQRAAPERQSLCVRKPRPASFMRSESVKESATEAPPRYVANGANGSSRPGNERYPLRGARAAKKLAVNGEANGSNGWLQPAVAQLRRAPASVELLPTACNSPTTTAISTSSPVNAASPQHSSINSR
ncbi:hypothetical protein FOCC_FOCC002268 [Frankliniella occidentalis]|nr:hypothetical protein FOCC_FOCC002268 [Frankliniella occidentalis]